MVFESCELKLGKVYRHQTHACAALVEKILYFVSELDSKAVNNKANR